ncbi:low molecular weight protein arginine phosphatase [Planococcus sp. CP5-4]|uniref:low molecular weight protein arginine phosphatase n=1 Tax=unclassified Planococcus (in: firmicutes) TaxID=2662419 RepID=UPI001C2276BF|nr:MULTISPECIES: low molecular weight protein arginine phosphatase [unclassified Planococcus (in: firmicutes)]MBU9673470.1 low molecular weight protein arginine phosphatase [Planococcus sp. CP5-4_YE]MBV0908243.1 low molecular weight protein arginine phosphatase [Planococcus sp. CP5-4_UN]MBW6062304.1 low molecular weight protein arginine phosphatase [Planococcus sp. CP5-4]
MKILFVCTGNTCRSPMAEAIVHTRDIEEMEARSAGIYAGQSPLSANAQKVLREQSIEFKHISKPLNLRDVEWAELILTMTYSHKMMLMQIYPEVATRLHTVKEFAEGSTGDVSDPYGGSLNEYRRTYEELEQLIDKMASQLDEK